MQGKNCEAILYSLQKLLRFRLQSLFLGKSIYNPQCQNVWRAEMSALWCRLLLIWHDVSLSSAYTPEHLFWAVKGVRWFLRETTRSWWGVCTCVCVCCWRGSLFLLSKKRLYFSQTLGAVPFLCNYQHIHFEEIPPTNWWSLYLKQGVDCRIYIKYGQVSKNLKQSYFCSFISYNKLFELKWIWSLSCVVLVTHLQNAVEALIKYTWLMMYSTICLYTIPSILI